MARCLIGCGSNLGRRREQLDRAVELLRFMPGVRLLAVSRYRETRPVGGPAGQEAYLNGACLLETDLGPHDVLGMLAAVENTLHRERHDRWGERTLDLDLLLYDDLVLDDATLTVPHPRMTTRRFVLEPAVEIAPELAHPLAGCSLRALLDNISAPHPLVAVLGVPGSGAPEVAAVVADTVMARSIHAPRPLPLSAAGPQEWREAVAAWTRPLAEADWSADPHGTVVDFWLGMIPTAAHDRLAAADAARLEADVARASAAVPALQVAILLVATADVLEERIAFRGRPAAPHTDLFADLAASTATLPPPASAATLVRLQERLVQRLRPAGAGGPPGPKAVITIDAADLARAADEAAAAVEAMI
jgi:2-amino-4-hydroxy-6-hydroxymethyldihydropteridine diphosphokinase